MAVLCRVVLLFVGVTAQLSLCVDVYMRCVCVCVSARGDRRCLDVWREPEDNVANVAAAIEDALSKEG
jgi:hypothetical protein